MRVAVGSDHAGFDLKEIVESYLQDEGIDVVDCGPETDESTDYPVFASRAAEMVSDGQADRAVLVCGSGAGVTIVANKFKGVRAVNAVDQEIAELSRKHNDANVLCLSGRRLVQDEALRIVRTWLDAQFEGGRHARRVDQIADIEQGKAPRSEQGGAPR